MAWNRPNSETKIVLHQKRKAFRFSSRGAVAYSILCIGIAAITVWLLWPDSTEVSEDRTRNANTLIKEVSPASTKAVEPLKKWRPLKKPEMTARLTPPARITKDIVKFGALPSNCLLKASIFKNQSEGLIAGILTATPGEHFLTDNCWDESFESDFKKSLADPTEIKDTDSEDEKLVKEAVMEAKQKLKAYMDNGESIAEIMRSAQQELEKVTVYRDQLEGIFEGYVRERKLEEALKFQQEANELLKEYNAIPITISERRLERIQRKMESELQNQLESSK